MKLQVKLQLELKLELKLELEMKMEMEMEMEMKMKMKMKVLPYTPHAIMYVYLQCFHLPLHPPPTQPYSEPLSHCSKPACACLHAEL